MIFYLLVFCFAMAFDFEGFDKSVVTLCHWAEYLINLQPWRQQIFHHGVESSCRNLQWWDHSCDWGDQNLTPIYSPSLTLHKSHLRDFWQYLTAGDDCWAAWRDQMTKPSKYLAALRTMHIQILRPRNFMGKLQRGAWWYSLLVHRRQKENIQHCN